MSVVTTVVSMVVLLIVVSLSVVVAGSGVVQAIIVSPKPIINNSFFIKLNLVFNDCFRVTINKPHRAW